MIKLQKKIRADNWLRRIYRMLSTTDIQFSLNRKLGEAYGQATVGAEGDHDVTIQIDPERKEFMSTILHECIHLSDWDLTEKQVMKIEALLMRQLTDRQLTNLLKKLADKI